MHHKRTIIIAASVLAAALVAVVAAFAYDSSRKDVVASGVRVGGVDIGGLHGSAARTKLQRELGSALAEPVVVRYRNRRFALGARRAQLSVDIPASVDEALARTRRGSFISRTWRGLTGSREDVDLLPRVSYSPAAVTRLVRSVRAGVERPAQDAHLAFSAAGFRKVKGRPGVRIDAVALRRDVESRLVQAGDRTVAVATSSIKPRLGLRDLPRTYPNLITIDRAHFTLRYWHRLRLVKSYTIAVGQQGLETPAGLYAIEDKEVNPSWHVPNSPWAGSLAGQVIPPGPSDPIKARWMGIADGAGIHGTDDTGSLGSAASHGCIRMAISDVVDLYPRVPVKTPVYIA